MWTDIYAFSFSVWDVFFFFFFFGYCISLQMSILYNWLANPIVCLCYKIDCLTHHFWLLHSQAGIVNKSFISSMKKVCVACTPFRWELSLFAWNYDASSSFRIFSYDPHLFSFLKGAIDKSA
jgi:hypothetical protein